MGVSRGRTVPAAGIWEGGSRVRRFVLYRDVDVNGVSGVGAVVWGIQFPDGRCAYRWNTTTATTSVADSIADIEAIHGHDGRTRVVWLDTEQGADLWRLAHSGFEVTVNVAASDLVLIRPDVQAAEAARGRATGES
jgi:hypothetical protein